jgi:hypothetical protein
VGSEERKSPSVPLGFNVRLQSIHPMCNAGQ